MRRGREVKPSLSCDGFLWCLGKGFIQGMSYQLHWVKTSVPVIYFHLIALRSCEKKVGPAQQVSDISFLCLQSKDAFKCLGEVSKPHYHHLCTTKVPCLGKLFLMTGN